MDKITSFFIAASYICIGFNLSELVGGFMWALLPMPFNILAVVLLSKAEPKA